MRLDFCAACGTTDLGYFFDSAARDARKGTDLIAGLAANIRETFAQVITCPLPLLCRRPFRRLQCASDGMAPEIEGRIRAALTEPGRTDGVRKIAARFGVSPSTVQCVARSQKATRG
jgi:hypothetical protein